MLKDRFLTALALAAVLGTVVLVLPPIATIVLLSLVILGGAWEWSAFFDVPTAIKRFGFVVLIALLLPVSWFLTEDPLVLRGLLLGVMTWWVIALLWLMRAPERVSPLAVTAAGVLALVPAWLALARVRLDLVDGATWTLFALVLIVAADTGAYFAGRRFGRVKLAPRVSPGKTWEGVFGGVALCLIVAAIGSQVLAVSLTAMLLTALLVAAFSVVGDLTESMLKRHAGVKDSGRVFPGHGGILDRIDSVSAGAPVLLWCLLWIGLERSEMLR